MPVWKCKLIKVPCYGTDLDGTLSSDWIHYSIELSRDGWNHLLSTSPSLDHANALRSLLVKFLDLASAQLLGTSSSAPIPVAEHPSLHRAIAYIAKTVALEIVAKTAKAAATTTVAPTVAPAVAPAVAPRVANNRTLVHGLTSRMALHDQSEIVVMLFRQLYRRWTKFCDAYEVDCSCEVDKRPSPAAVQQFIDENLDWAKVGVMARLNRLMWHHDFPKVSPASGYDEYDSSVKI
jgi:hypothetical protein